VIIEVESVRKEFVKRSFADRVKKAPGSHTLALDDVSLGVSASETLGIVGESGSGKSTLARLLVGLMKPDGGEIRFHGDAISAMGPEQMKGLRRRMQLIYQDPYSSLNPALTVKGAIAEPVRVHGLAVKGDLDARVAELMQLVGLSPGLMERRPAALSGGQRQRVAIARALAVEPEVLIADEALSALDVSIQTQILQLFAQLQRELGLTLIFISHQLGTIRHLCERVCIMHEGRVVECGRTTDVFERPSMSYTKRLLAAQPGQDRIRPGRPRRHEHAPELVSSARH
jgi:ABC-type glutathione transport system ATPase component